MIFILKLKFDINVSFNVRYLGLIGSWGGNGTCEAACNQTHTHAPNVYMYVYIHMYVYVSFLLSLMSCFRDSFLQWGISCDSWSVAIDDRAVIFEY